jgi:hypothetical protein
LLRRSRRGPVLRGPHSAARAGDDCSLAAELYNEPVNASAIHVYRDAPADLAAHNVLPGIDAPPIDNLN